MELIRLIVVIKIIRRRIIHYSGCTEHFQEPVFA